MHLSFTEHISRELFTYAILFGKFIPREIETGVAVRIAVVVVVACPPCIVEVPTVNV
jgi:hypothetical protein